MPFMNVGSGLTDTGGNYNDNGLVTAVFNGQYVKINDDCGSAKLQGSGGIDWGASGGTDCATPGRGGNGNTHSSRTNWYELNKVMEMARSHLPNNSWLRKKLVVNVNINDDCNAWWLRTINFYRKGSGCGNTGELAGVIVHEWGHGLDDNDVTGSIAKPSGEGIADIYAALRMDDSCVGRGFFTSGSGCTGVRNIDFKQNSSGRPLTFSNANKSCRDKVHCLGRVYGEAVWSLYKRHLQSSPYNYNEDTALEIVTRLTFIAAGNIKNWYGGSPPWGGCGSASGYREYLAADDDNGNINDGTPHMSAIFKAFDDQEIACSSPNRRDSGCNGTPDIAPQVTVIPGNMQATITWTAVNGASNYQVFRTEGVKECRQGKVKLATTTARTYTDNSGLMNGRKYYYIVIPKRGDSCFGPASACSEVTPQKGPVTNPPTRKPSPPTMRPTPQPTKRCGNGYCDLDESSATCPLDCNNVQLNSLSEAPRGAPGIMISIQAKSRDIEISSFKFFTWQDQSVHLVQLYTRTGRYTGFELNRNGWQLIYQANRQLNGDKELTECLLSNQVVIPSGTTQSFFIWANGADIRYELGLSAGAVTDFDNFINLYDGTGITSQFSGSFNDDVWSPRSYVGIISYNVLPSPTASPTKYPTMLPTKPPTMPPTKPPTMPPTKPPTKPPTMNPTGSPTMQPVTATPTNRPTNWSCMLLTDAAECNVNNLCMWRSYFNRCTRKRTAKAGKRAI